MTNTESPTATAMSPDVSTADPRTLLAGALEIAGDVLARVRADQGADPTPCADWEVAALSRHMVAVARRVAAIGDGVAWEDTEDVAADVATDGVIDAWAAARADIDRVWADEQLLGRVLAFPFGDLSGGAALTIYVAEFTIHAWDLATATSQTVTWDEDLARLALVGVTNGVPVEGRGPDLPFDPVVAVSDDAPTIDRVVAWMGRQP